MEKQEAQRRLAELREQIRYHSRKYYTEDDPEISDFAYDQLYRQLETLEAEFPDLVTEDSPTQKIGGAVYNTFAEVVHQVPLESLHDSFSQEELRDLTAASGKPWGMWSMWWSPSSTAFPWRWSTGTACSSGALPEETAPLARM